MIISNGMILLGITGHPSAGKDTVADYLVKKHGFTYISTSDLVRDEIKRLNLGEPTRDLMYQVAINLRGTEGSDVLIRKAIEKTFETARLALGGIRAVAEAAAIKTRGGKIVVVATPLEVRFARARVGDPKTLAEFKAQEDREAQNSDPVASSINDIVAEADFTLLNDGSIEKLE